MSGCANFRAGRPDPAFDTDEVVAAFKSDKLKLDVLVDAYYADDADADLRKKIRNKVIDVTTVLIDQNYEVFRGHLSANRKGFDSFMDIGSMATDAVAVIATPALTKSILAAISGGLTAAKTTIDKNYFYEQTTQVLVKQMDAQRSTVRAELALGVARSVDAYSLSAALSDLQRYYFAGSIDGGLTAIQQNAALEQETADKALKAARKEIDDALAYADLAEVHVTAANLADVRAAFVKWYDQLVIDAAADPAKLADVAAANAVCAELAKNNIGLDDAAFATYFTAPADPKDEDDWVEFDARTFLNTVVTKSAAVPFATAFEAEDILKLRK